MESDLLHPETDSDFMEQINAAVYLVAQSLYTVGYGDVLVSNTDNERMFSIVMMFLGAFILATTIGTSSAKTWSPTRATTSALPTSPTNRSAYTGYYVSHPPTPRSQQSCPP
jgi:hypothetical protein